MRIDAHHHFWKYDVAEYDWIDDRMEAIRRDFLPEDLKKEITSAGIDGAVPVQARQMTKETEWLLEMAYKYDFIKGVVGWVPLTKLNVVGYIERFALNAYLKGVRHVLHDEPDEYYMLRDDFNEGVKQLKYFELVYDILIFERHLPQTIKFVDRHPQQLFVLDHIAKPLIKDNIFSPWRKNIMELAERENVYCKISGMVTEANWQEWTEEQLKPYFDIVLEAFWPERLMFGSDWPVCLVACEYQKWCGIFSDFVDSLSNHEKQRILGGTAIEVYKLEEGV